MRCALLHLLLLLALPIGCAAQDRRTPIRPEGAPADLPFSPAVAAGDLIWVSGALPPAGTGGIEEQTTATLARLDRVLRAAGADLSHAVQSTVYLADSRDYAGMNRAYGAAFPDAAPTRATVEADLAAPHAGIEIALVAARPGVAVTAITPEGWPEPTRPYRWGLRAGDTVFVSGMVARDVPSGELVTGDVATQTRKVLENVGAVLAAAGLNHADVVSSTVFLADTRDFAAMNAVYREFFPAPPPARATVRARLMNPRLRVEIQCVAVRDPARVAVAPTGAPTPLGPYSPSILAGGRQYLSGMVARGPGDVADHTRRVLGQLKATLAAAGLDFGDVVATHVYLADIRGFAAMNAVYRELLPDAPPARATVGTQLVVPDAHVEIGMVAVRR